MNWQKQIEDFKKGLAVEKSSPSTSYIRFGFFGSVGSGKSVTSGILSLGITPEGLIGWIDGEGRRSGYAIDQVADMAVKRYGKTKQEWIDRFKVVHVDPPFNPLKVVAAIECLEEAGCRTIIGDVLTQAWDSDGGYLDLKAEELNRMAGDDINKQMRSQPAAAAHIKPWTHQKLVNKINNSKCHFILVFQGKQKWNPKANAPNEVETPIQESGLTRTALAVGRIEAKEIERGNSVGGFCYFRSGPQFGTKYTHPGLAALLPKEGEQFKFENAEAIARWCAAPSLKQPSSELETLKRDLWNVTMSIHGKDSTKLDQWLSREEILLENETLAGLTVERLPTVIKQAKEKLNQPT